MPPAPAPVPVAPLSRPRLSLPREALLALLPTVTVLLLLWLLRPQQPAVAVCLAGQ